MANFPGFVRGCFAQWAWVRWRRKKNKWVGWGWSTCKFLIRGFFIDCWRRSMRGLWSYSHIIIVFHKSDAACIFDYNHFIHFWGFLWIKDLIVLLTVYNDGHITSCSFPYATAPIVDFIWEGSYFWKKELHFLYLKDAIASFKCLEPRPRDLV